MKSGAGARGQAKRQVSQPDGSVCCGNAVPRETGGSNCVPYTMIHFLFGLFSVLLRKKINQPILQRGRGFLTSRPRWKCAVSSQPTRLRQATATLV